MRKPFRNWLVWGAVLNISCLGPAGLAGTASSHERDPVPVITVRVFNFANVGKRALAGAKKHARKVLSRAEGNIR